MEEKSRNDDELMCERKEKLLKFFKNKYDWLIYVGLAIVVYLAVKIRTLNLSGLRDVTTGGWTLGPDLDPFLFMRYAKEIILNGTLPAIDNFRYVPIGFNTREELLFHPYMMAWFHKVAVLFGSTSIEQSSALYPVFMFALTVIAFFFLARKIFVDTLGKSRASIIALISSFFLTVLPSLLPRTIAGIPEKESAAFLFLFLAFYFFLGSWKSKHKYGKYAYALLAGASTAGMALIWGGFIYVFLTIGLTTLFSFLLGQMDKKKFYVYGTWLISSILIMRMFSTRYGFINVASSTTTGIAVLTFFVIGFHFLLFDRLKKYLKKGFLAKIPEPVLSLIFVVVIGIIILSIFSGGNFVFNKVNDAVEVLIKPTTGRIGVTVAENRQPYFTEWEASFGPHLKGVAVFFWIFFIGSAYLFFKMIKKFDKKERIILTLSYLFLLTAIVFSRYTPESVFNGENFTSIGFYFLGVVIFAGCFGYYYYKEYKFGLTDKYKTLDYGLLLSFFFFFLTIISARGAVRLIMVLVPSSVIIASYFVVSFYDEVKRLKGMKIVGWIVFALLVIFMLFSAQGFYQMSISSAQGYYPSAYNQQWQKAMSWVRDNTPQDAVFGHWWDYGYWIQTIGERATVLDGGNAIGYWNHLMGRYALTGPDEIEALNFLYAHGTTHFLIDSTDIGKYGAFASIGSDADYDRRSWLTVFLRDNTQVLEKKNSTVFLYRGGFSLDDDLIYEQNGSKIYLPGLGAGNGGAVAGVGAVSVERDDQGNLKQPVGIFVYQSNQYVLPLRYAYDKKFIDFGTGIEAGVFLMPRINQDSNGQVQVENDGSLIYLSERTVKSQLARLYLYNEQNHFKLVHTEDDFLVANLRAQGVKIGDFAYFNGIRGPIKVWEIDYPTGMEKNESYLNLAGPSFLSR